MNGRLIDVGRMGYQECWELQREIAGGVIEGGEDSLIFVEHPPVLTLGANFHAENLLLTEAEYRALGIELASTDRGGDVTYHGPGQLVIYPIFDIQRHGKDLHKWMRDLEETMLVTLEALGIEGRRFPPHTGAWVGDKKIAAIGVKIRRWVNIHGIALNCDNDLDPFGKIVPRSERFSARSSRVFEVDTVAAVSAFRPSGSVTLTSYNTTGWNHASDTAPTSTLPFRSLAASAISLSL